MPMERRRTSILFFIFYHLQVITSFGLRRCRMELRRKFIIIIFNHTGHQRELACDDAERRRKFCRQMPGVHRHEGGAYTQKSPTQKRKTRDESQLGLRLMLARF